MKIVLAAALALFPFMASAATLTITDVNAQWVSLAGKSGKHKGLGTNAVSWGVGSGNGPQSGYVFKGTESVGNAANEAFTMGTFSHRNNAIARGSSIKGATLRVAFSFMIDSAPNQIFTKIAEFRFRHDETRNNLRRCANRGLNARGVNRNGCADEVTVRTNRKALQTFRIDGVTYAFDVTGFSVGKSFWTTESRRNSTRLTGRFTEVRRLVAPKPIPPRIVRGPLPRPAPIVSHLPQPALPAPIVSNLPRPAPIVSALPRTADVVPPAPVPLPAAGVLLLMALAGLAAARRRA